MRKTKSWPDDPVVEEVRRVREAILKEAGGTIEGLIAWLDREVPAKRPRKPRPRRPKRPRA